MRRVSLREANQNFAKCIAEVEAGEELVLTRHGEPVARIIRELRPRKLTQEQEAAAQRMLARMQKGYAIGGMPKSRDEIYER